MNSKFIGIPKIVCLNYNDDIDKMFFMKNQFDKNGLEYFRYEKKYTVSDYEFWKELILDKKLKSSVYDLCETINLLDSIIEWYDSTDDEYCIFMSDIVSFDPSNYWFFNWEKIFDLLPYNWDCINLYYSSLNMIKMHLHPWRREVGFGTLDRRTNPTYCFMISRYFAKRLKHYHYVNGKYRLHYESPNTSIYPNDYGTLNDFLFDCGITYNLPILSLNRSFLKNSKDIIDTIDSLCAEAIEYWWRANSKSSSEFYFFNYNKNHEWKQEVLFDYKAEIPYIFRNSREQVSIWI
jgi:hypothetical protein